MASKRYERFQSTIPHKTLTSILKRNFKPSRERKMLESLWSMSEFHDEAFSVVENGKNVLRGLESGIFAIHYKGQREYHKAVYFISQSIIFAEANSQSPNLAYAYATRSEILYDLGQYEKALLDVHRAIACSFPKKEIHLLNKIKLLCIQALKEEGELVKSQGEKKEKEQARGGEEDHRPEAQREGGNLEVRGKGEVEQRGKVQRKEEERGDEVQMGRTDQDLKNTLEGCDVTLTQTEADSLNGSDGRTRKPMDDTLLPCCLLEKKFSEGIIPDFKSEFNYIFNLDRSSPPEMFSYNPKVPCLSNSVDIGYSVEKGRYIYATQDLKPGDVISKEQAHMFAPFGPLTQTVCGFCSTGTLTPIPCPTCVTVIFCGENCRREAINSYHKLECPISACLLQEDPRGTLLIVARILFQTPFAQLRDDFENFRREKRSWTDQTLIKGFNKQGFYNSDLRTLYCMKMDLRSIPQEIIMKACFLSLHLTQLIVTETAYLGEKKNLSRAEGLDKDCMDLALIVLHFMLVVFNNVPASRLVYFSATDHFERREFGSILLSVNSLFNHSCDPNTVICNYGLTTIGRANRFIPAGTELTVSYLVKTHLSCKQRLSDLQQDYYFHCRCEVCKNDWNLFNLSESVLVCPTCRNRLDLETGCLYCGKNEFEVPSHLSFTGKSPLTARGVEGLLKQQARCINSSILGDADLSLACGAVALYDHFAEHPSQEKSRLQMLINYNYLLRAFHLHDRNRNPV